MEDSHDVNEALLHTMEGSGTKIAAACLLIGTISFEVVGTLLLRSASHDVTHLFLAYGCYMIGLTLFSHVVKHIPLSIAYSTWCSAGTIGVCTLSQYLFGEDLSRGQWICIVLTIPCIVGMYIL